MYLLLKYVSITKAQGKKGGNLDSLENPVHLQLSHGLFCFGTFFICIMMKVHVGFWKK